MMRETRILLLLLVGGAQAFSLTASDAFANSAADICNSYRRLAESGNVNAQVEIANCYIFGFGRDRDFREAEKWLTRAVENGSEVAPVSLASLILFKLVDKSRYGEAVEMLRISADKGSAEADFALYLVYRNGMGVPKNSRESGWYLDRAAGEDHLIARFVVFGELITGERQPEQENSVSFWRGAVRESIDSRGIPSVEEFGKRIADDELIAEFVFSRTDVERVLEQL